MWIESQVPVTSCRGFSFQEASGQAYSQGKGLKNKSQPPRS
jgi:hypothetical protein